MTNCWKPLPSDARNWWQPKSRLPSDPDFPEAARFREDHRLSSARRLIPALAAQEVGKVLCVQPPALRLDRRLVRPTAKRQIGISVHIAAHIITHITVCIK